MQRDLEGKGDHIREPYVCMHDIIVIYVASDRLKQCKEYTRKQPGVIVLGNVTQLHMLL